MVLPKNGKNAGLHSTHKKKKQWALLLRLQKPTKMANMAGVTQAKPPFVKNTVFATPRKGALIGRTPTGSYSRKGVCLPSGAFSKAPS